jgi:hypothetical protein
MRKERQTQNWNEKYGDGLSRFLFSIFSFLTTHHLPRHLRYLVNDDGRHQ